MTKQVDVRLTFRRMVESPGHVTFGIWVNGGKAGDLTVRQEEATGLIIALECGGFEQLSSGVTFGNKK
jgi:hypothetical protein